MQNSQTAKWLDDSIPRLEIPEGSRIFFETRDLKFCRRVSYGAQTRTLLGVLPASGFTWRRFLFRKNILSIGRHQEDHKNGLSPSKLLAIKSSTSFKIQQSPSVSFPDAYLRVRLCSLSELQAPSSKTKCLWRRRKPSVLSEDVVQLLNLSTIRSSTFQSTLSCFSTFDRSLIKSLSCFFTFVRSTI